MTSAISTTSADSWTRSHDSKEPVYTLRTRSTEITILGTAHISKASTEQVIAMVKSGQYDAVAVELCPSRYNALINPDSLAKMNLLDVLRSGKGLMVVASLALGAYQERLAKDLGVEPGGEMRAAVEAARESKLPVLLVDREISVTLKRMYQRLSFWRRFNLLNSLIASTLSRHRIAEADIERLKEGDLLESAFSEFANKETDLFESLISERDEYMSARLQQEISQNSYQRVLVIVGAGHLMGMRRFLASMQPSGAPEKIASLDQVAPPGPWLKIISWSIIVLVLLGFVLGFSRSNEFGWKLLWEWTFIHGGLAALGCFLSRAHILTTLSAFVVAPLTALNPAISAGLVTGTIEAVLRKPKVAAFKTLREDAATFSGWWRNDVARVLLIFSLSNIGSAMGTYIAGSIIFHQLVS